MIKTISSILKKHCPINSPLILAISGGPDSVCLLHILKKLPYRLILAHVNHQLRGPESDLDEEFVKNLAKKYHLPIEVTRINVQAWAKKHQKNLEESARILRYNWLEQIRQKHQASYILTAHHQRDNIETVLLNIFRGCSWGGLKGMSIQSKNLLRPLLTTPKKAIDQYLKQHHLKFCHDSTNDNLKLKRNFIRHKLIPYYQTLDPDFENNFAKAITSWQAVGQIFAKKANQWLKKNLKTNSWDNRQFNQLSSLLQSEIISQLFIKCYGSTQGLTEKIIDHSRSLIKKNHTNTHLKFGATYQLTIQYNKTILQQSNNLTIQQSNNSPIQQLIINGQTIIKLPDQKTLTIKTKLIPPPKSFPLSKSSQQIISLDFIPDQKLFIRFWQPGDKMQPLGLTGQKKLQDIFTNKKIPRQTRHQIPLLINQKSEIIAILGISIADPYKITSKTKQALLLTLSSRTL